MLMILNYIENEDKGVSLDSFCTNNNAAMLAVEETYGDPLVTMDMLKKMKHFEMI